MARRRRAVGSADSDKDARLLAGTAFFNGGESRDWTDAESEYLITDKIVEEAAVSKEGPFEMSGPH